MRLGCLGRFRLVSRLERSFVVEHEVVEEANEDNQREHMRTGAPRTARGSY